VTGAGDPTAGLSTVAESPPWEIEGRARPTWGLAEGDEIAPGRSVLGRLGGGRRYEVFLVWDDHRLAVLVAKVLRPDQATDAAALRELGREADALARLAHPVIVRGFDAVADGRLPHLLIEHLEGPTLLELIERDGALAAEQALPLGLHVASALHYLAAEDMVHLDVKPENIVMGAPPRLIDFSVARPVSGTALLRGPIGTDAYMAPEQCDRAHGPLGPPADVFGLAATLHHAVGGTRPFPRRDGERFPQTSRDAEPLPRRVPQALAELLHAALSRAPGDRPTATEFASGLEPLIAAMPRRMVLGRRTPAG
jgi:eukaryotic-like serine/threonine-protein kinase